MKIKLAILAILTIASTAQAGPQFGFYVTTGNQCGRPVYYQRPTYVCTPVYAAPRRVPVPVYYGSPYGYYGGRRDCNRYQWPPRRQYNEPPGRWKKCSRDRDDD